MAIKYNGNTAIVLSASSHLGNLRAFAQAIIRYINTGKSADFGSTDKVELSISIAPPLNSPRTNVYFMDPETYKP